MRYLKKIVKALLLILLGIIVLFITLILLFIGVMKYIDRDEGSACWELGLIWDYDEKRCRDDCLTFVKGKGCISLEVLSQIDQEICGGITCTPEQKLLASKRKCEIYKGAIDQRDGHCNVRFQLKDCGQLKGDWLYPKECGLSPEQTF